MIGRLLCFLDERVQHDDALAHHEAVERPAYPRSPAWPEFKESIAEGAGVRQAKVRAVFGEQLDKAGVVREDIDWPGLDLSKHAFMEVLDLKRHGNMLPNMLTLRKASVCLDA
ncbi:hypothetical protein DLNHIDIE_03442 [Acidithiobacillus thiooxidans ATCC 19377]|jgi:hypothetical protein|uniref:Uncharacterized protein n=2 Tax=Acidithiobacillus thiooxidans TaxID=930 RepID=A0A1C2IZN4_ACITH|nr:hypothetical protein A6M23_16500 [Acidithiobacillus thiooxidans]OCX81473.1 hypothetical protein A6P08_13575 [Acidithiobacillus thiooxidans]TQN49262.1 hypothetical protein DLNHIDIE_03442 [Acidithiobacillus thiooxidans ATCC 19377]